MLGLPWASYRENLSHNLTVTPPISMCDQLIYQTCVLLPYWLIFSSEPLKIQLTMDLCKETIYWFTLCVICWKTLKKCYSWLALHVNIVQWPHCKPFSKIGTRALPMLLQIWKDGCDRTVWVLSLSLLRWITLERSTLPTILPWQQLNGEDCCCWLVRVYMTLKIHVWGHKPDWWLLGLKIMNQVFVNYVDDV
jgi:hypothetical protein